MKKLQEQINKLENKISNEIETEIIARITITSLDHDYNEIIKDLKKRNFNLIKTENIQSYIFTGRCKKETWEKYLGTMTI